MFNVLIADDENFVIKSLCSSIAWDMLNLTVTATCTNGLDALDIIEHHCIDILITDIRMPGFTGLDLCSMIHAKYPNIQIIIISGYADFAYAQKAIKYNILGYCLKPLDFDEITLLLRKAATQLMAFSSPLEDIMDSIENDNYSAIAQYLLDHNLDPAHFSLMVSLGNESLTNSIICTKAVLKFGAHKYLYLLSQPFTYSGLTDDTFSHIDFKGVGVYPEPINTQQLKHALHQSIIMSYQFFFKGSPYIEKNLCSDLHTYMLSNLQSALTSNNFGLVNQLLTELTEPQYLEKCNINFALKVCNLFMTYYIIHDQIEKDDCYIYSYDQLLKKFHSFPHMIDSISQMLCQEAPIDYLPTSYNNNFIHVLKYINHHYMEDITIKDVSESLNLNANYISQLFKKETGITYTKYLTQLRMEKAKHLLTQTNLSLSEICDQVGYNDYFYFLKTFKKYEGISPSNYKNNL